MKATTGKGNGGGVSGGSQVAASHLYVYNIHIYLEPNRPIFWGVDLQFYGSNLPKYGSFGF